MGVQEGGVAKSDAKGKEAAGKGDGDEEAGDAGRDGGERKDGEAGENSEEDEEEREDDDYTKYKEVLLLREKLFHSSNPTADEERRYAMYRRSAFDIKAVRNLVSGVSSRPSACVLSAMLKNRCGLSDAAAGAGDRRQPQR
jgi:hypothetical protein